MVFTSVLHNTMQCAIILDNAVQYKFIQAAENKEQVFKRSFKCGVATETNVRIVHILFLNFSSNNGQLVYTPTR